MIHRVTVQRDLLENELAAAAAPAAPHFLDEICTFLAEFRSFRVYY